MKTRPPRFGIRAIGNVMIGGGTFIKAPGYKLPIETEANTQIGDGTFIDTSEEGEKPKEWHDRPVGKVGLGVMVVALGAIVVGTSRYFLGL